MRKIIDHLKKKWIGYGFETLVVIAGIYGAFSLNNWNEDRKNQILEINIYEDLYSSLRTDSIQLVKIINDLNVSLKAQELFISNTHDQIISQYHPEELLTEVYKGVYSFFPKYGVYELIISNNHVNLLSSVEIKSALVELYDYKYRRYENIDKIVDDKFQYNYINIRNGKMEQLITIDNKVLSGLNSSKFEKHYDVLLETIRSMYDVTEVAKNVLITIQVEVNGLLKMIRNEIDMID